MRTLITATTIATACALAFAGCIAEPDDEHHDDITSPLSDAEVVASCSQNPNKQAVCHIPPGNPANAHTICISVNAVDKHLSQHGDFLGACDPGSGGSGGQGGASSGAGGTTSSGTGGSTGSGTPCSEEYPPCSSNADCSLGSYCDEGCCVPYTN